MTLSAFISQLVLETSADMTGIQNGNAYSVSRGNKLLWIFTWVDSESFTITENTETTTHLHKDYGAQ